MRLNHEDQRIPIMMGDEASGKFETAKLTSSSTTFVDRFFPPKRDAKILSESFSFSED